MLNRESPIAVVAQAIVAMVIIVGTVFLAYLDPNARGIVEGAMVGGVGTAIGFLFSQGSAASAAHQATNGMNTMAGLITAGTPGPTGPPGPPGKEAT